MSRARAARRVRVVVPVKPIMQELETALLNALRERCDEVTAQHEPSKDLLDADLLLLTGECRRIKGLASALAGRTAGRPHVVVWQTEPLPPPAVTPYGEMIGRRVGRVRWSGLPRPLARTLEPIVPFRTRLIDVIRSGMARGYIREVDRASDHQGWGPGPFDIRCFNYVMCEAAWLLDLVAEGLVDRVVTSTGPRAEFLKRRGVDAHVLPVGYDACWGRDLDVPRDIDALFIGTVRKTRRPSVLQRLAGELGRHGSRLTIVDRGCFGAEREKLLNRARVVVNLIKYPWDFPGIRMLMAMGCRTLVVSETADDMAPYLPGVHFVGASPGNLADTVLHYLEHDDERRAIADAGHRFVTEDLLLRDRTADLVALR